MAATPRPSVDCTSRACSSDPGERGRVRSRDPGREPAHRVNQRFGHRLSISLCISVHLERLTSRQGQQRGLNRYAALDRLMCPEFVMGTSLSVHMHMCTYLGPDAASKQVWPRRWATSRRMARAPQAPQATLADARCELRPGLCPRPITPSESTKWRKTWLRMNAVHTTACSLHLTDKASRERPLPRRTAPGCISQIILRYIARLPSSSRTARTVPHATVVFVFRSRDPQFQDGSRYDIGSVLQEQFTNLRERSLCDCDLLCYAGTRGGVGSALWALQPPFLGAHSAQITVPVPSSVSVLPASNLGRYHSFANGFLFQTRLRTWGPCN